MPQIIVTADAPTEDGTAPVMFRERVTARDFESGHFANQLVERLGWAVDDAHAVDREASNEASEQATDRRNGGRENHTRARDNGRPSDASARPPERESDSRAHTRAGVPEADDDAITDEDSEVESCQRRSARVVTTAS